METIKEIRSVCNYCRKEFLVSRGQRPRYKKGMALFCSKSCSNSSRYESNRIVSSCEFCKKKFKPTYIQIKESLKKEKPVFCTKSCRAQHQYIKNRGVKKCLYCGQEFEDKLSVLKIRKFCSGACSAKHRVGGERDFDKTRKRLLSILKEDSKKIIPIAKRIAYQYGIDHEDILQDYYLALLQGQNTIIQKTAYTTIKNEFSKGFKGVTETTKKIVNTESLKDFIPKDVKEMSDIEKKEILIDIEARFSEHEYKIAKLMIMGFGVKEIKKKVKGSSKQFLKDWNWVKYGLKEKDYSNFGDNYKKRKDY